MRFRVRSLERDDDADARRLSSIERPLSIAIAEAKSELEGLRRRLESARQRASVLVGDEPFESGDREPENEQLLLEAEEHLIAGERRVRQLAAHVHHLAVVLELLKRR
jgi:hypothetical protein